MAHASSLVLDTHYFLLSFSLVAVSIGCNVTPVSTDDNEPSLAAQIAMVGKTERIQVEKAALRDADLSALRGLTNLRTLQIDDEGSRITSAGIACLAELPNIEHLRIRGGIDGPTLATICTLKSLRILNLPRGSFADADLQSLKQLSQLEQLRFGSPNVTDAGIKTIASLPALKRLHLIDVPITDAGLRELIALQQLESLYIDGGTLSDVALDELFRMRHDLHVHLNQQHHDRDSHSHQHK